MGGGWRRFGEEKSNVLNAFYGSGTVPGSFASISSFTQNRGDRYDFSSFPR